MTLQDLDRLAELESAATPGPLRVQTEVSSEMGRPNITRHEIYRDVGKYGHPATCEKAEDAMLFAAIRNAAKDLISAARREARLREAISEIIKRHRDLAKNLGAQPVSELAERYVKAWSQAADIARAALAEGDTP